MRIELIRRASPSALFSMLSPILALALTVLLGALIFAALGKSPSVALYTYFIEPLIEVWSLHELVIKATPLILIAVGLSVCYLSNNWNIGAEGQYLMGAIAGSALPVLLPQFQNYAVLPIMFMMAMIGGALYAAIPALLKTRFNTNEILSSLMLVYVAQLFLDWLVRSPWRNPEGYSFPGTITFNEFALLPEILPASGRAHFGIVIALILAVLVWLMLKKTKKGFEIRVLGQSPRAGRFAGFSPKKMTLFAFIVSGALAGLAGIIEVSGAVQHLNEKLSTGYGFAAIIIAFLGRLNPLGIIAAGFLLALTYLGGEAAQISLQVSNKTAAAFQGVLLFLVLACDVLIHYRIRFIFAGSGRMQTGGKEA